MAARRIVIEAAILALLMVLFFRALDPAQLRAGVARITPAGVAGVVGFQAALIALATLCWAILLHGAGIGRSYGWTLQANLGGFAVTYLTPAISCSGAPVRAAQYRNGAIRPEPIFATIALDTFVLAAGKIPTMTIGAIVLIARAGTGLGLVMGGALLALIAVVLWLLGSMLKGSGTIVRIARRTLLPFTRISPRRAAAALKAVRAFAVQLDRIGHDRRAISQALGVAALVGVLEVIQNLYILSLLGIRSIAGAFAIHSNVLVQAVIGLLPGNIGGMEAANAAAFTLLGWGPATSLVYTLIFRLGHLSLVIGGLAALVVSRVRGAILRQGTVPSGRHWKGTETAALVRSGSHSTPRAGSAGRGHTHSPRGAAGRVRESF
jgi:hypothetical protein